MLLLLLLLLLLLVTVVFSPVSSREESRSIENSRLATTQGPGQNATRKPRGQETATTEAGRKVVATARPPRVKEKGLGVRKKRSGGKKKGTGG